MYDPNRTAFLMNIVYTNGLSSYILSVDKLKIGSNIIAGLLYKKTYGCSTYLVELMTGIFVNNMLLSKMKKKTRIVVLLVVEAASQ